MKYLSLLKFPLGVGYSFLTHPFLSIRNSYVISYAFWRSALVGSKIVVDLETNEGKWGVRECGRHAWSSARGNWARRILECANVHPDVRGFDRVDWTKPHVIVCNHFSTIDILILTAIVVWGRFVLKAQILGFPFIGPAARRSGQIPIDRDDHEQSMSSIRSGMEEWSDCNIIFFAGGTRSPTGEVGEFKSGAAAIAKQFGIPILPIAIHGTHELLPPGPLLNLAKESNVTVVIGDEIEIGEKTVPELTKEARDAVVGMLQEVDREQAQLKARSSFSRNDPFF